MEVKVKIAKNWIPWNPAPIRSLDIKAKFAIFFEENLKNMI